MMDRVMGVTEARSRFGEIVDKGYYQGYWEHVAENLRSHGDIDEIIQVIRVLKRP